MFSYLDSKNNNNNNTDLSQGNSLLQHDKNTAKSVKPHLSLIGKSSSSNLGSVVEALQSDDSTKAKNNINLSNISKLDDEFNRVLVSYSKNYKLLVEELMHNESSKVLQKYAGKNVKLADSNKIYYVNNYGFTHEYSDFSKKPNSCSSEPIEISPEDFKQLPASGTMPVGMECGIAGYNIEDKTTGEVAWVDIKGQHHSYPKNVWEKRSESCKGVPLKQVNHSNIVALTPVSQMTEESMCNRLNVDPKLLKNVATLNEKLISLAKELLADTERLAVKDVKIRQQLDKIRGNIQKKIGSLEQDKTSFTTGRYDVGNQPNQSLANIREDTDLRVTSNFTRYLLWLVLCIGLIVLSIYSLMSTRQSIISQAVILLVAVIVLYKILVYIYNSLF